MESCVKIYLFVLETLSVPVKPAARVVESIYVLVLSLQLIRFSCGRASLTFVLRDSTSQRVYLIFPNIITVVRLSFLPRRHDGYS